MPCPRRKVPRVREPRSSQSFERPNVRSMRMEMDQSVEPYCLITSLCALRMIQPGMSTHSDDLVAGKFTNATRLLEEILRLRKTIDYIENPTLEIIQTSLFLFACYFGLDQHNKAW